MPSQAGKGRKCHSQEDTPVPDVLAEYAKALRME